MHFKISQHNGNPRFFLVFLVESDIMHILYLFFTYLDSISILTSGALNCQILYGPLSRTNLIMLFKNNSFKTITSTVEYF